MVVWTIRHGQVLVLLVLLRLRPFPHPRWASCWRRTACPAWSACCWGSCCIRRSRRPPWCSVFIGLQPGRQRGSEIAMSSLEPVQLLLRKYARLHSRLFSNRSHGTLMNMSQWPSLNTVSSWTRSLTRIHCFKSVSCSWLRRCFKSNTPCALGTHNAPAASWKVKGISLVT